MVRFEAPPNSVLRLQHGHPMPLIDQGASCRQTRNAGTHHEHAFGPSTRSGRGWTVVSGVHAQARPTQTGTSPI